MRKLLFLTSVIFTIVYQLSACGTSKKNEASKKTEKNSEPQSRNKIQDSKSVKRIEHGTVNPEKLDSIKTEKAKAKSE